MKHARFGGVNPNGRQARAQFIAAAERTGRRGGGGLPHLPTGPPATITGLTTNVMVGGLVPTYTNGVLINVQIYCIRKLSNTLDVIVVGSSCFRHAGS